MPLVGMFGLLFPCCSARLLPIFTLFCGKTVLDHPVVVHVKGWDKSHVYCVCMTLIEIVMCQSKEMVHQYCGYSHD